MSSEPTFMADCQNSCNKCCTYTTFVIFGIVYCPIYFPYSCIEGACQCSGSTCCSAFNHTIPGRWEI